MTTDEPVLAAPKDDIDFDALPWNPNFPEEVIYVHESSVSFPDGVKTAQNNLFVPN
jgi:hypothetical protein